MLNGDITGTAIFTLKSSEMFVREEKTNAHILAVSFCSSISFVIGDTHFIALQIQPGILHPILPPVLWSTA